MIGFYNYTLVLTFLSLVSAVFGMTQAAMGNFQIAVFCLAFAGLCDAFDGKVARTKKDRSDNERLFGVQLDSLCDVIGFGAFPALICYMMGVRGYFGGIAISYYCICSVIRLAYFNMIETNRMQSEEPGEKVFYGLPITSITVILPVIFLLKFCISDRAFPIVLVVMLFAVGTCFILNFKMHKPSNWMLAGMILVVAAAVIVILLFSRYQSHHTDTESLVARTLGGR